MVNGFIHKSEGGILILPQKRFTLNNYLWFVFLKKFFKINFLKRNPRSCFFRILFTSIICFIFIKLLFYQFKEPLFVFKTNKTIIPSKNKFLNFTIKFSNVQKDYLMEEPFIEPCEGKQIKLLVLIMSRRETFYKRMGIRKSWAKDAHEGIIIRYVIGGPKLKEENSTLLENKLQGEQKNFGDLIRYSIEDGYNNLHFKMGAAYQWQQKFCSNAEFVMKTDDDTIVDLPRLEFWIEKKFNNDIAQIPNKAAFFGMRLENLPPIRNPGHKWYVSFEHFPGKTFPNYMQGASYLGNGKAIKLIMQHTKEAIGFNMDDILFTGTLAEIANVSRIDYAWTHFRGGNNVSFPEI
ncbi:unnamed protein product [Meloidogyne enterolobii]|uniref:Uncharacterized protein n=1 Tax=Meloidogyne enterolobii TaxID=390850 RepID=A0ACB1ANA6_MELEN